MSLYSLNFLDTYKTSPLIGLKDDSMAKISMKVEGNLFRVWNFYKGTPLSLVFFPPLYIWVFDFYIDFVLLWKVIFVNSILLVIITPSYECVMKRN